MNDWRSLAHTKWECKYHIVFVPKYRKKKLYGKIRSRIGDMIRELCRHKDVTLLEGHAMPDHIHVCLSIPPKYSVSMVIGYLKGKSAIRIHKEIIGINRGFTNKHFWTRGYCVSTVGLDEDKIREYIKNQELLDQGSQGQLNFDKSDNEVE
jgi:putative transposase